MIGPHQLGVVLVTLIVLGLLFVFFRYTPLGLAMRAAAQNPQMARLVGVRVDWMLALGWGLAASVGAVAGIMVAHIVYLEPNMMGGILLYAFAGALVGGISNPGGAVAGGFIVGVLENMVAYAGNQIEKATGVYIIGNGEKLTVALIIVIFVLTVQTCRPVRPRRREEGLTWPASSKKWVLGLIAAGGPGAAAAAGASRTWSPTTGCSWSAP